MRKNNQIQKKTIKYTKTLQVEQMIQLLCDARHSSVHHFLESSGCSRCLCTPLIPFQTVYKYFSYFAAFFLNCCNYMSSFVCSLPILSDPDLPARCIGFKVSQVSSFISTSKKTKQQNVNKMLYSLTKRPKENTGGKNEQRTWIQKFRGEKQFSYGFKNIQCWRGPHGY